MLHSVSTPTAHTAPMSDGQLRAADEQTRAWYLRVLLLMNETACSIEFAVAAVAVADQERHLCAHDEW
jgi:hypothetical protein